MQASSSGSEGRERAVWAPAVTASKAGGASLNTRRKLSARRGTRALGDPQQGGPHVPGAPSGAGWGTCLQVMQGGLAKVERARGRHLPGPPILPALLGKHQVSSWQLLATFLWLCLQQRDGVQSRCCVADAATAASAATQCCAAPQAMEGPTFIMAGICVPC